MNKNRSKAWEDSQAENKTGIGSNEVSLINKGSIQKTTSENKEIVGEILEEYMTQKDKEFISKWEKEFVEWTNSDRKKFHFEKIIFDLK